MATTKCQYQYYFLDGPDILPKISLYERVIVESLNLNHPFADRWAASCVSLLFFQCVLSQSQIVCLSRLSS